MYTSQPQHQASEWAREYGRLPEAQLTGASEWEREYGRLSEVARRVIDHFPDEYKALGDPIAWAQAGQTEEEQKILSDYMGFFKFKAACVQCESAGFPDCCFLGALCFPFTIYNVVSGYCCSSGEAAELASAARNSAWVLFESALMYIDGDKIANVFPLMDLETVIDVADVAAGSDSLEAACCICNPWQSPVHGMRITGAGIYGNVHRVAALALYPRYNKMGERQLTGGQNYNQYRRFERSFSRYVYKPASFVREIRKAAILKGNKNFSISDSNRARNATDAEKRDEENRQKAVRALNKN
eukprot:1188904-Prorocentrum_minimum.AAC.2